MANSGEHRDSLKLSTGNIGQGAGADADRGAALRAALRATSSSSGVPSEFLALHDNVDEPIADVDNICELYPCLVHPDPTRCNYPCEVFTTLGRLSNTNSYNAKVTCYYLPVRGNEAPYALIEVTHKNGQPTEEQPLADTTWHVGERVYPPSEHRQVNFVFKEIAFKPEAIGHVWTIRFRIKADGTYHSREMVQHERLVQNFETKVWNDPVLPSALPRLSLPNGPEPPGFDVLRRYLHGKQTIPNEEPHDKALEICTKDPCPRHPRDPVMCIKTPTVQVGAYKVAGQNAYKVWIHCFWLPIIEKEIPFATVEVMSKNGKPTTEDPLSNDTALTGPQEWPGDNRRLVRLCFKDLEFGPQAIGHTWTMRFRVKTGGWHAARTLLEDKVITHDFVINKIDPSEQADQGKYIVVQDRRWSEHPLATALAGEFTSLMNT